MKPYLTVLVPSRGRPHTLPQMVEAFRETCTESDSTHMTTRLVFVVDTDDPLLPEYMEALYSVQVYPQGFDWARWGQHDGPKIPVAPYVLQNDVLGGMNAALNAAALNLTDAAGGVRRPFAVASFGDDHRPRKTGNVGWDTRFMEVLHELRTGIVYGDDKLQGAALPTAVAMTSDIVRALGHMAPGSMRHLYIDNYWLTLGQAADCIRYLPDVVIEHMHPGAGKAPMDEHYARVNSRESYEHDHAAFEAYKAGGQLTQDADLVRSLRIQSPPLE